MNFFNPDKIHFWNKVHFKNTQVLKKILFVVLGHFIKYFTSPIGAERWSGIWATPFLGADQWSGAEQQFWSGAKKGANSKIKGVYPSLASRTVTTLIGMRRSIGPVSLQTLRTNLILPNKIPEDIAKSLSLYLQV